VKTFVADLHVHTALSPCAEVEMIPPLIVEAACAKGIDLIAVTDHNASANIGAVQKAAQGSGVTVLPGMELQTREEVHLLCLFDSVPQVEAWQMFVDARMPADENDIEHFGEQFVVDHTGEFICRETRLLLTSANLTLEQAVKGVDQLGGVVIPAHVNRQAYGLIANLGFVPTSVPIEALEISRHLTVEQAMEKFPQIRGYPLIQSGDVHRLDEFLGSCVFTLEEPTIAELRLALRQQAGRSIMIRPG
jgi:3',5'-nucleoside bisphosphate phosphatase